MSKNNSISDLFPYLHENNLKEIRTAQRHVQKGLQIDGKSVNGFYFHGDGNIYFRKSDSDDRIQYRNHEAENAATQGAAYRLYFDEDATIPKDLKTLESLLVKAQSAEKKEKDTNMLRGSINPNALPAYEDEGDNEEGGGSDEAPNSDDLANKLKSLDENKGEGDPGAQTGKEDKKGNAKKDKEAK